MNKTSKIIIAVLVIIILILLARFVIFKTQIDAWELGLQRIDTWEAQYKSEHPNASKQEIDAAFKSGIQNMSDWKDQYKKDHPDATDTEVDAAFNSSFNS